MKTAPNFDRLARLYRWLEYFSFGPYLQRARTAFLPHLPNVRMALVLGDGDGRFTAVLLRAQPRLQVHAVDASARMLAALLRQASANAGRVSTEVADLRHWRPADEARYDLVATHFFLDCLTTDEIAALAGRIAPSLMPGALWVISDFHEPPNRFGRLVAAPVVSALYRVFGVLTGLRLRSLPDHALALESGGWTLQEEQLQLGGLLVSQLWRREESKPSGTRKN